MPYQSSSENDFLLKITRIIEANISNDKFGVSELAEEVGMSRSNLLRKIKKLTNQSVSQFVREVRLQKALTLIKQNTCTVSEVSYQVGFSSVSYFIKCFREFYGYSPGEAGKQEVAKNEINQVDDSQKGKKISALSILISLLTIAVVAFFLIKQNLSEKVEVEKSIAVLPFKNDSNDSSNVYFINGLMESVLTNLQKIEDVRVISRTSVEKYRNTTKSIAEIAEELNVSYFVEGSGQKIGDQILLNIQLIEASTDKHLWAEQYNREAQNVFSLQNEIAKKIAGKIEVVITPEEEDIIDKVLTDNLEAYDYFLKGLDLFHCGNREGLNKAISYFEKAIEHDPEFARAYADIAMAYYYLDITRAEKKYTAVINENADKALLFDSKLPQSLIAKALYYMNKYEFKKAVPYLEKALQYNPNSAFVINFLSDYYTSYMPNTSKYLEYALKGIRLDIAAQDSVTASYICLHLSNAFVQTGFVDEAELYINKSMDYNPQNMFSEYVKAYILYAKNKDLEHTKDLLLIAFHKDTTRLDILQEIGKVYYYMRDYETSYTYYKHFISSKEKYNLNIYPHENCKIARVLAEMGMKEKSEKLLKEFFDYASKDKSIYKNLSLAIYYAQKDDTEKALEHLQLFSEEENLQYWIVLFLKIDPLVDSIKDHSKFKKTIKKIEKQFWKNHKEIKLALEKEDLL